MYCYIVCLLTTQVWRQPGEEAWRGDKPHRGQQSPRQKSTSSRPNPISRNTPSSPLNGATESSNLGCSSAPLKAKTELCCVSSGQLCLRRDMEHRVLWTKTFTWPC